jgi:hypothetical protein
MEHRMSKIKDRSERKRVREALKHIQSCQRDRRVMLVIFESSLDGDLPQALIDEMNPERILIAQEDLKVIDWIESESLKRGVCKIAQSVLLGDKSPERFVLECESLGFAPSKKAKNDFPLKLLEAICFLHFTQYQQSELLEDLELPIYPH